MRGKPARPVLRGPRRGNAQGLPDNRKPGTTSSRPISAAPGRSCGPGCPTWSTRRSTAYLIVHHAICALIAKASAAADLDPDRISFAKTLRLIRRSATGTADIPP